jgi:hypothetical protein
MSFVFQYAREKHPPLDEYDCGVFDCILIARHSVDLFNILSIVFGVSL